MGSLRLSLLFVALSIFLASLIHASPIDRNEEEDALESLHEVGMRHEFENGVVEKRSKKDHKNKDKKHKEDKKHKDHKKPKKEKKKKYWDDVENDLKKNGKGHYKTEKDDPKKKYPKHMKEKVEKGEKLQPVEIDTFENEYGDYKNRSGITVTDLIDTINKGHDVILEESDVVEDGSYDYKIYVPELKKDHKRKKHKGKREVQEKRDARRDRVYLWMDRIVPYEIDSSLDDSASTIKYALSEIESKTCIKFEPQGKQKNWVKFVKKSGCWSTVGKTFWAEGPQELSLGSGCMYHGIIMHEVMHALGFWHEQSRPDRNKYVEIFWENIEPGNVHNFAKKDHFEADMIGSPYDLGSVMHYGKYSFAINASQPTIQKIGDPNSELGQRLQLSELDVYQINKLYSCSVAGEGWSDWSSFSPCKNDCKKERSRFCMNKKDKTSCKNPTNTLLLGWGVDLQTVACPAVECYASVDGHWNKWGDWGECSISCGEGIHSRKRVCTDPSPRNGGNLCVGVPLEIRSCLKRSCDSGPADCNFDIESEPICLWTKDASSDFHWRRNSGSTPSSSTGPNKDHTSGTGHYLFIESSSPTQTGWAARLLSPNMKAGPHCLHLAYSMYGQSTGTLNIKVKDLSSQNTEVVFTKSGDQLQEWRFDKIDINGEAEYQVIIEAIRGFSFQGDIGIDDIAIKKGTCDGVIPTEPPTFPTTSRIGCYKDKGYVDGKRPFPEYNDLRSTILKWSENMFEMRKNLHYVVGNCSAYARANSYKYFSVEFYGECWTGNSTDVSYGRDGETVDCYPDFDPIVGKDFTMMVYQWDDLE